MMEQREVVSSFEPRSPPVRTGADLRCGRERMIEFWDFFSGNYAIFCAWQRDHDAGISIEPLITQNRHVTRSGRPLLDRPPGGKIQQGAAGSSGTAAGAALAKTHAAMRGSAAAVAA